MTDKDARWNRLLILLIGSSFFVCAAAVVLRVGLGATPYETTDSAGRPMGFNDPLHAEHYAIIVGNFNLSELFSVRYVYLWLLFLAHLIAIGILLSSNLSRTPFARLYFIAQAVLFPFGLVALPFLPFVIFHYLIGPIDREGFVDVPFIAGVTQSVWLATSLAMAFLLRGRRLEFSRRRTAIFRKKRQAAESAPS